jgi:Flp pilus assembly protein TadG
MNSAIKRLRDDRAGNFAIFGGILCIPLVMGAGLAIDLSTISQYRSELQQAIDAATLAVAREGKAISDEEAQAIADTFIATNLDPNHTRLTVVRQETLVSVRAETRAPMAFGALFGYDEYPVVAAASADTAYATYEVALVLDTTGSMQGGKLVAMKDAVSGLIDTMSNQVNDKNKLRFSLVPFSSFVNVGPEHGPKFDKDGKQIAETGAEWLDLAGASPVAQSELEAGVSRFQLYANLGQTWSGCVESRMEDGRDFDVNARPADPSEPESLYVPAFAIDEPDEPGYANSYIRSDARLRDNAPGQRKKRWAKYGVATNANGDPLLGGILGLLGLGGGEEDDEDEGGGGGGGRVISIDTGRSGFQGYNKGPNFGCGSQPIVPLTNDYASLKAKVDALTAQGTTNITEGVAWGTRVLTPGEPFGQAQDRKKTGVEKIMIVLTDGSNVLGNNNTALRSSYSSYGYLVDGRLGVVSANASQSNVLMNDRTLAACTYAKEDGMTVYTIRLEEPDVKTGMMLEQCATSPAHFFDAPSRSQLDEVFQTIKDRIARVRIAS